MTVPNVKLKSWLDDRLPEMIWAALMLSWLGRTDALPAFRRIAKRVFEIDGLKLESPTLTGIGNATPEARTSFINAALEHPQAADALRPMLLFGSSLPAVEEWSAAINQSEKSGDWRLLAQAVALCFDHQSQEATDCRWLKVLFIGLSGRLHLGSDESIKEILDYPEYGDMRKVRPTIRAMEGAMATMDEVDLTWPTAFWRLSFSSTDCAPLGLASEGNPPVGTTLTRVVEASERLRIHHSRIIEDTRPDPKLDAVFGIGLYCLRVLEDSMRIGTPQSVLGRLGLRTILEAYLTLKYLVEEDDPKTWELYRRYGAGQAKLAFLKRGQMTDDESSFVDVATLELLASEDRWLEFQSIELGHWKGSNLRRLAQDINLKPVYDEFYDWTSAFVHSNWAAVRNATLVFCGNPLHRLHRIPAPEWPALGDITSDAAQLVGRVLEIVETAYPGSGASLGVSS